MPVTARPSAVQSSASSGVFANFPQFSPEMIDLPGAQQTNAAIQSWWNTAKYQLLQQNDLQQQTSLKIRAESSTSTGTLAAEIDEERTVRANADSALATSITTVTASLTTSIGVVAAAVITEATARATADGFLSANYSITVTAGSVVTGMQLNSSIGGGTTSSTIDFQAANFRIWDGSATAYPIFSTAVGSVKLASTLTVNTAGKVFTGTGTYGNNNTPFYVDSSSNFSLGSGLTWNGTTLTINGGGVFSGALSAATGTFSGTITATAGAIGGWTINSTTLSKNNAILDSAGNLALGTSNDVVLLSATDATYRLWVGNTTAGSAAFSVQKNGVMTATGGVFSGTLTSTAGTIGGFTLSSGALTGGTGIQTLAISTTNGIVLGNSSGARALMYADTGNNLVGFSIYNSSNVRIGNYFLDSSGGGGSDAGALYLYNSAGALTVALNATSSGVIQTGLYLGSGASLTSINASNISSGTLNNGRLPSAISVASLALSTTLTMTNSSDQPFDITNGTVTFRSVVNNGTARANWGTTTNHSVEIFTNSASRFFFGNDGNFKTQGGDFRKVSSDGWSPILYDGSNQIEFQASGGQIFGRINGGSPILLG